MVVETDIMFVSCLQCTNVKVYQELN